MMGAGDGGTYGEQIHKTVYSPSYPDSSPRIRILHLHEMIRIDVIDAYIAYPHVIHAKQNTINENINRAISKPVSIDEFPIRIG